MNTPQISAQPRQQPMYAAQERRRILGDEGVRRAQQSADAAPPMSEQLRANLSLLLAHARPVTKKPSAA